MSNLSPEGVSMGFLPPGSVSDFLGWDPPAELEPLYTIPCAALSTLWHVVKSASLSTAAWLSPGCSHKDCVLSGNVGHYWEWEPEASLCAHPEILVPLSGVRNSQGNWECQGIITLYIEKYKPFEVGRPQTHILQLPEWCKCTHI